MGTHPFENRLESAWNPADWRERMVLVAVSGGADSVALVRGLAAIKQPGGGKLVVAHFNHRLRGEAADADERFVVELAEQLGFAHEIGRADALLSAEEDSRRLRYEFLKTAAERVAARYVVTAHTADDQAETILHRILRGTGIAGLAGMRRARPLTEDIALLRPLLMFRRAELRQYLADIGQSFREDATNVDPRYTRNRLRNELLPLLERDYNPVVVDALLRLGTLAGEAQEVLAAQVAKMLSAIVQGDQDGIVLDCRPLADSTPYLIRELLIAAWRSQGWPEQAMGFAEWSELAELVRLPTTPGKPATIQRTFPGPIVAQKTGDRLSLARGSE